MTRNHHKKYRCPSIACEKVAEAKHLLRHFIKQHLPFEMVPHQCTICQVALLDEIHALEHQSSTRHQKKAGAATMWDWLKAGPELDTLVILSKPVDSCSPVEEPMEEDPIPKNLKSDPPSPSKTIKPPREATTSKETITQPLTQPICQSTEKAAKISETPESPIINIQLIPYTPTVKLGQNKMYSPTAPEWSPVAVSIHPPVEEIMAFDSQEEAAQQTNAIEKALKRNNDEMVKAVVAQIETKVREVVRDEMKTANITPESPSNRSKKPWSEKLIVVDVPHKPPKIPIAELKRSPVLIPLSPVKGVDAPSDPRKKAALPSNIPPLFPLDSYKLSGSSTYPHHQPRGRGRGRWNSHHKPYSHPKPHHYSHPQPHHYSHPQPHHYSRPQPANFDSEMIAQFKQFQEYLKYTSNVKVGSHALNSRMVSLIVY